MKVGVLSDTHMRTPPPGFSAALREAFQDVGTVLHCGDCVHGSVLDMLSAQGWEVLAVAGNMDPAELHRALPRTRVAQIGGRRIGMVHGWGAPDGIEKRVLAAFDDVDGVVYGHSHRPQWRRIEGTWLFNPGAACGWGSPLGPTVGVLEIGADVEGRIVSVRFAGA